MKENNLVLNEQSIKRHIKRLSKALKNHPGITVSESVSHMDFQEFFSQTLGFKNWHELHELLVKKHIPEATNYEKNILPSRSEQELLGYLKKNIVLPVNFLTETLLLAEVISATQFMPFMLFLIDKKYPNLNIFQHFNVEVMTRDSYFNYRVKYRDFEYANSNELKDYITKIIISQENNGAYDFSEAYEKYRNEFGVKLYGYSIGKKLIM